MKVKIEWKNNWFPVAIIAIVIFALLLGYLICTWFAALLIYLVNLWWVSFEFNVWIAWAILFIIWIFINSRKW